MAVAIVAASVFTAGFNLLAAQEAKRARKDTVVVPRLFRAEAPLAITLTANFKQLKNDRSQTSPYRPAKLSYTGADGKAVTMPLKVKTHGVWRLKNCDMPPLRFNFANKDGKGTLFRDIGKPKVVSACHDRDSYEQLVLQEMQLYRIYQVLTPESHRVRTLRITYVDSATGKTELARHGFLFEDPDILAARIGGKMLTTKGAGANDIEPGKAALVYLFEYLIANTDFSFNQLHNGELVIPPDAGPLTPVAYDFDFSGAVNAPYATADPKLRIKKVRERLYRGYCAHNADAEAVLPLFRERKARIYALYNDELGKLLDPRIVKETLTFFDEFYDVIKSEADARNYVLSGCVGKA